MFEEDEAVVIAQMPDASFSTPVSQTRTRR